MALVDIKDYTGDLIKQTVMEALEMVGIVNKLNINGYHLSILGIPEDVPKGKVDDTPSKHVITIDRNKFIKQCSKHEFKKIENNLPAIEAVLNEQDMLNIDFEDTNGREITHEISHDESNYVWYKHMIQWEVSRPALETEKSYINRMFNDIADYVVKTFESMMDDEGDQ